ncbi:MAG: carbohydrate ABC transporter permease [Trueperaceae bacterium]|nr:carbohydrate ABC transporter permease [Trueperaceae bacterium]
MLSSSSPHTVRSAAGVAVGVVVGALTAALLVTVWSLLATLTTSGVSSAPLGWATLSGAVLGAVIIALRRGKDTPAPAAWAAGAAVGAAWAVISSGTPLGFAHPFWGAPAAVLVFTAIGQTTRYGLRDLDLGRIDRSRFEILLLRGLRALGFTFFLAIVILPFWFMLSSSFKPRAELLRDPTNLAIDLSRGLSELFVGYREVLVTFDFARFILNSTFVASVTVIVTLALAVMGAYAVTRLRFPGREWLSRSILLIYMFPAIVMVIPLYTIFSQLGLRDTLPGLLIVYPATTLPVALYMLRSYFQTLPKDLEEAGLIDGATRFGVIMRITLPLSLPALASVGLYVFMIAWNEFLFAFMFLDTPAIFTLSRGMVALNSQEVPRQFLMAGAVIVTVPIMVLFFWFEKYLVGGLTAGGVKG